MPAVELKAALRAAEGKARYALEVFCGVGHVARLPISRGALCIGLGIKGGIDVCNPSVLGSLCQMIREGRVWGLWLGPPCSSWSLARRVTLGCPGGPLRTMKFINGLPHLKDKDREKVRIDNRPMQAATEIMSCAIDCDVPCCFWKIREDQGRPMHVPSRC